MFHYNSTYLCSETESADVINSFFAGVAERLLEQLNNGDSVTFRSNFDSKSSQKFEEFSPLNEEGFLEIIGTFNYSKSSGYEEINCRLLLDAMKCLPNIFIKICNCSFTTGKFPESCKNARVTIIPKGGDLRNLDNLRPISILPLLGKVLEKHAKQEIVDFFEMNDLFYFFI